MKDSTNKIFDIKYANTFRDKDSKVILKKHKFKGVSLYACKPIKKGSIIANYKFKVHRYTDSFRGKKNNTYAIFVITKSNRESSTLIGDIYEGSLEMPKNGITFLAYFSNEPSDKEDENAELDYNIKGNYKTRKVYRDGDTMIYRLRAIKDIKKGQEILWCYGSAYTRDYKSPCE